jgi:fructose/tagatose bisphosphate aldolase
MDHPLLELRLGFWDDFQRAIATGIVVVHISTELRLAWRRGLEPALAKAMAVTDERLHLFNSSVPAQEAALVSGL